MNISKLQDIIDEYHKSGIQSEAEVSSKWIVPLLEVLGYPTELRSEEFPVYGYGGSTKLQAKPADFLLFADKDFASHRERKQADLNWVYSNSLLVVEAKKPGKLSDDNGQAQFYNAWSRAVGYILTDGDMLRGFYYNPLSADFEVIESSVDELVSHDEIWMFSYENVLKIKDQSKDLYSNISTNSEDDYELITSDDDLEIPEETLEYVRSALGKDAEGLSNVQQLARFLNATEFILKNDLRHDIPDFYFGFPRDGYHAKLYVDSSIFSAFDGDVSEYYWEDYERYYFESDSVEITVIYYKGDLAMISMEIHAFDNSVSYRINDLKDIKKLLEGKTISIVADGKDKRTIKVPVSALSQTKADLQSLRAVVDTWIDSLEKLRSLEEYYDISFDLEMIPGAEIQQFYEDLEFVYNGTIMEQNYTISGPADDLEDTIMLDEPEFLQELPPDKREQYTIHGITFETYRTYLLPCEAKAKKHHGKKYLTLPVCCECIVKSESRDVPTDSSKILAN